MDGGPSEDVRLGGFLGLDRGLVDPERWPAVTRRHGIFLAVFIVLVAIVAVWRVQVQEQEIKSAAWRACMARNDNIARATQLYRGLIAIERDNPVAAQSTIERRIALYTKAIPHPSDCGGKP